MKTVAAVVCVCLLWTANANSFVTETSTLFGCELNYSSLGFGPYDSACFGPYLCRDLDDDETCPGNEFQRYFVNVRTFDEIPASDPFRWSSFFPSNCTDCPVLFFATAKLGVASGGLGSLVLTDYDQLFEHIASMGVVVIPFASTEIFNSLIFSNLAESLDPIISYARDGQLAAEMAEQGSSPRLNKVIYGGHAQGARLMMQRMVDYSCQGSIFGGVSCECEDGTVGGFVLLSPVEDFITDVDFGNGILVKDNVQIPWTTPVLIIGGELDGDTDTDSLAVCAPEDISSEHFYNNWAGPAWYLTFKEFGHFDMIDFNSDGAYCATNDLIFDGDKNPVPFEGPFLTKFQKVNLYRRSIAAMIVAFIDGLLNGNPQSFEALQTDLPPTSGVAAYDVQDLRVTPVRKNVPTNVLTAGIAATCTISPKLFSDEIQLVIYSAFAFVGISLCCGAPIILYCCVIKPSRRKMKRVPMGIKSEMRAEGEYVAGSKNPTFAPKASVVASLAPQVTPPPGMDDGLTQVSEIAETETVIPYETNVPQSVRLPGVKEDDIF